MLIRRSGITPREIKIWQHLSYCMNLIKMIDSTEKKRIKNVRQYLEVDTLWHISRAKTWVVRKLKIYLVQIQDLKSVSRHQLQSKKLLVFFVNFLEVLLVFYFKLIEINFVKYFSHFFFLQFAPNFIWSQRRNRILVRMHISQVRAKVVVGKGHRIFSHQLCTTSVIFVSKKRQKNMCHSCGSAQGTSQCHFYYSRTQHLQDCRSFYTCFNCICSFFFWTFKEEFFNLNFSIKASCKKHKRKFVTRLISLSSQNVFGPGLSLWVWFRWKSCARTNILKTFS